MGDVETNMPVFSTTVYGVADAEVSSLCDPFWTLQNGGYCSDANGNYIRRDGTIVPVQELTGDRQLVRGVDNSTLVVIALSAIVLGLLMRNS